MTVARFVLAALLFLAVACRAEGPTTAPTSAPATTRAAAYEHGPRSPDGTGKYYMGREIAHFMSHLGAPWLERPERDVEENTAALVDAIELRPDDVVADIGVGTGYYAFRLAPKVPRGKVLGVDIQPEMLELLTAAARRRGVTNVEPVLGTTSDPKLPTGGVDVALMVDAYHEFDHPREMMESIVAALKPGGRVVLVEFRAEDPAVRIKRLHKMSEAQAVKELTAAGLRHVETKGVLPQQHLLIFEKPPGERREGN